MKLRRCAALIIEPHEELSFDLADLIGGGSGARREFQWRALVPWQREAVRLSAEELLALSALSESQWREREALEREVAAAVLDALLAKGVALSDDASARVANERDDSVRAQHWLPVAAAAHYFTRWQGIDTDPEHAVPGYDSMRGLVGKLGAPPPVIHERGPAAARMSLPETSLGELDALLARRVTCRNFDQDAVLARADLACVLARVYGVQGRHGYADAETVVKKNHPSGGALHPLEAYVVVQRVEGLVPGLYHYHAAERALQPLPPVPDLREFVRLCTGGQRYFARAPAIVVMTARFSRSFWKYRRHAKAYRALLLEAGHASQNFYLAATDLGLGAFVTAAVNESDIEAALGLDPLAEGVILINGLGARGTERAMTEFDPNGQVWGD
jgi:putative peptide maturation dehydrogenase